MSTSNNEPKILIQGRLAFIAVVLVLLLVAGEPVYRMLVDYLG